MSLTTKSSLSRAACALVVLCVMASGSATRAQTQTVQTGTIQGTVSTQDGTVKLPGVLVGVLRDVPRDEITTLASDESGRFSIPDLPAGRYRVRGTLDGFQSVERPVAVAAGEIVTVDLDLPLVPVSESVEVVASPSLSKSGSLAATATVTNTETQRLTPGEGFRSAVHLIPGVIDMASGQSIDGGRPNQAAVQIGAATLADTATNLVRFNVPANAVDTVSVLPNPYEAEFGRFSSGLVLIETKRAQDHWKVHVDDLEPALRLKRFTLLQVTGIAGWKPTFEAGGPLVKGRLFLEQTAQYRYQTTDIPSLPETELRTTQWFSSLTRMDASLSSRDSLVLSVGAGPGDIDQATLGTFTPPAATADITERMGFVMLSERSVRGSAVVLDATVQLRGYQTSVAGHGPAPMALRPETTDGNFFNQQDRTTTTFQWVETASGSHHGPGGLHVYKVGVDVLHAGYEGTSASGPVLIERSDKTLARRLDFDGATAQSVHGTDVAVFAQDRFQPSTRWQPEFGLRADHDAFARHVGVSPRVGMAVILDESANTVLRGGYGLFFERTPSVAAAFGQFESALDTRFAADGQTVLQPPELYEHVTAPMLQATRSAVWDLAYENHLNRRVMLTVSILHRQDSHGLIVDPVQTERGAALLLSSEGRAEYFQQTVGVRVTHGSRLDVNASYVHSFSREDLNGLTNFFDSVMQPVIGNNAYAPGPADAPNRLFVRGSLMPTTDWLVFGILDWRSGLPWSVVNEDLEFVGPRNDRRFPTYLRLNAGFEHRVRIARMQPWLGLRVNNALNSFLPSDVYSNITSPAFGTFANSEYREFRIHLRFER